MDIKAENITFSYDYTIKPALQDVSFSVEKGEFVALIGANGSGKSTLARHLNAVNPLQKGSLYVLGMDVGDEKNHRPLRRNCGMVFQNPDNQFVSAVVEEDVAFGLYNYDETDVEQKVEKALRDVGMEAYARRTPSSLSGGQKQRIAIAGVLILSPGIVVFDEATSMIDPKGREETLGCLEKINSAGKTVVMITHFTDEAALAKRVIVMNGGKIIADGPPREILSDLKLLSRARLTPPFAVQMYYELLSEGIKLKNIPLTGEELAEEICALA